MPTDVDARLRAAVSQALGQGYNLYTNRIDPQWFKPLGDAAICFARHPAAGSVADQIMGNYNFQQSDECRRVRKAALRMLLDEIGQAASRRRLQRLINWISANDPAVEKVAWQKIAAGLRSRWDAEPDWQIKNQFGGDAGRRTANRISARSPGWSFSAGSSRMRRTIIAPAMPRQLFNALLGQPWKQAYEDEAFGLLAQLAAARAGVAAAGDRSRRPLPNDRSAWCRPASRTV